MGSAVAYEEVEASIQALRYGGGEDAASGTVDGVFLQEYTIHLNLY